MKKVSLSFAIWLWQQQQCGAEEGFNYSLLQISSVWWWQFPLFSCQGQAKTFFFCQDDEDDEGYFGSSLTFVGQILFCYARFVLSSAKIFQSSDAGRGGRGESLSWENNNINEHVSKCRGIFTKDNVTQPLQKKTRPDYCGKWQHAIRHSCNYHFKILLLSI